MPDDKFRKSYEGVIDDINPGKREVVAIINTDAVDREGEVVMPSGLRKKQYAGMTIDFNHDKNMPIGISRWVRREPSRTISKYYVSDKTEFSRDVFSLIEDKVLRFHSIDGIPYRWGKATDDEIKAHPTWKDAKRICKDWEMINFCVCTAAVNPEAVAQLIGKGIKAESLAIATGVIVEPKVAFAVPSITVSGVRCLTDRESVAALAQSLRKCLDNVSVDDLIERAFNMASGKI